MRYHSDTGLTAAQTDQMILELRRRGLSYAKIGKHASAEI
jgi:hypothetical protein